MVNNETTGWSYGVDASDTNKMKWAYDPSDLSTSTKLTLTNDGKLGIGTTSPSYKLDVSGDINLTGSLRINGTAQTFGGSSAWTESSGNVYRSSGNVGINTSTPQYKLDVDGDIRTTSEGGFRGNGRNITGINITSERNDTIINFGQQSSLKKSANGNPL